jgi:RHS repeat-associated protein
MDGTSYSYERRGLLTTVADDDLTTITFAYDADGNRASLGYPSGRTVHTTFDFAGRPVAASADGASIISSASYLPFGPMTAMAYSNGTTRTMLYDNRYRLQENKLSTSGSVIADYVYQEDAVGNITQIHDATNAAYNRDFGYDDLNRLTTANSGSSLWGTGSYQYDAMGNMTSLHIGSRSLSFAYAGTTPRIQSVSGTNPETVTYDNAGNEVVIGTYSARNHLQHIGDSEGNPNPGENTSLDYVYDGRGVRVRTLWTTPGVPPWGGLKVKRSVYSPELHLIAQSDWLSGGFLEDATVTVGVRALRKGYAAQTMMAARTPRTASIMEGSFSGTEYLWFTDQPVAQFFTDSSFPTRYTFTDHLGTPILQTDAAATVVWRAEYEPYGSIYAYRTGDASDPQALRLPGQEYEDSLPSQSYNIFRWYRSEWGRYTQSDPIKLKGGLNLYTYTDDNPISHFDPKGLKCSQSCPDCPGKKWLIYGADIGFTVKIASMGYGISFGIFNAKCFSSSKACTFYSVCSRGFGVGVSAAVSGGGGVTLNAPCANDFEGRSFGFDAEAFDAAGGTGGVEVGDTGAVTMKGSVGLGGGASGTFNICKVTAMTCN